MRIPLPIGWARSRAKPGARQPSWGSPLGVVRDCGAGVDSTARRAERGVYTVAGVLKQPASVRLNRRAQHLVMGATAARIAFASSSHRRVEPSTSVNKNVTTPDGAPTVMASGGTGSPEQMPVTTILGPPDPGSPDRPSIAMFSCQAPPWAAGIPTMLNTATTAATKTIRFTAERLMRYKHRP